jgi:regulator of protease activity HflC (stomatin/prohibitin superfamily)
MTVEAKRSSPNWPVRLLIGCSVVSFSLVCGLFLLAQSYLNSLVITIGPEERGVVISPYEPTGYVPTPLASGKRMLRPGERVEIYKIVRETYSSLSEPSCCTDEAGAVIVHAKDNTAVTVDYQIVFAIDPEQLVQLHLTWQHLYKKGFVIPQTRQAVAEAAGAYTSAEIALSKRDEIEQIIVTELEPLFSEEGLILLEFRLVDVRLRD